MHRWIIPLLSFFCVQDGCCENIDPKKGEESSKKQENPTSYTPLQQENGQVVLGPAYQVIQKGDLDDAADPSVDFDNADESEDSEENKMPAYFIFQNPEEVKALHNAIKRNAQSRSAAQSVSDKKEESKKEETVRKKDELPPKDGHSLLIRGILYKDATSWCVWLGDHVCTPTMSKLPSGESIRVMDAQSVEITGTEGKCTLLFLGQVYKPSEENIMHTKDPLK